MRRVARPLLGTLAVIAVVAASAVAASALLDTGSAPTGDGEPSPASPPAPITAKRAAPEPHATPGPAPQTRPPAPAAGPLADDAATAWAALARSIPARLGLAVAPLAKGETQSFGPLQVGHAWSTLKVPILVTLMRNGNLSPEEEALARAALTASDNAAAAALFGQLEALHGGLDGASEAVQGTLRAGGDAETVVATAPPPPGAVSRFGQTEWSLANSVRFFRALGRDCLLSATRTDYVLGLMEEPIPEQQWGIAGSHLPPQWRVTSKGGWGPEGSESGPYLVRQAGIVDTGEGKLVVAAAAQADSGSFATGVAALDRVAGWLGDNLARPAAAGAAGC